jgi:L-ascorbate metabolism protein UlaG (beta-lactamase superfamily)
MRITKLGHCCLLIEVAGSRILTDPGEFSDPKAAAGPIDAVLISHEHPDHLHVGGLRQVLEQNPDARVITNESVGEILAEHDIEHTVLAHEATHELNAVRIKAYDGKHVEIFADFGLVQNTGFLIGTQFFYPGDAYTVPQEPVNVLALPVAGPWCKLADAIRYAIELEPKWVIPVHDGVLNEVGKKVTYPHCLRELHREGIMFREVETGSTADFTDNTQR